MICSDSNLIRRIIIVFEVLLRNLCFILLLNRDLFHINLLFLIEIIIDPQEGSLIGIIIEGNEWLILRKLWVQILEALGLCDSIFEVVVIQRNINIRDSLRTFWIDDIGCCISKITGLVFSQCSIRNKGLILVARCCMMKDGPNAHGCIEPPKKESSIKKGISSEEV